MKRAFTFELSRFSCFSLFALSDSLNGLSESSGNTADTNAMLFPSGDHIGCEAPVDRLVSFFASPPSAGRRKICVVPSRSDSKAIHFPSGDQRGWRSCLGELVSFRGSAAAVCAEPVEESVP